MDSGKPKRKVEQQVKVLIKNLAIFFLCPSKHFCRYRSKSGVGTFSLKTEGTKQLGYIDKLSTTQI